MGTFKNGWRVFCRAFRRFSMFLTKVSGPSQVSRGHGECHVRFLIMSSGFLLSL